MSINYPLYFGRACGILRSLDYKLCTKEQALKQFHDLDDEFKAESERMFLKMKKQFFMDDPKKIPMTEQEKVEMGADLGNSQLDLPTPAEVDEMARLDEARRKTGRTPHEL